MPTMERRTLPQLGHRHLYITFTEFWWRDGPCHPCPLAASPPQDTSSAPATPPAPGTPPRHGSGTFLLRGAGSSRRKGSESVSKPSSTWRELRASLEYLGLPAGWGGEGVEMSLPPLQCPLVVLLPLSETSPLSFQGSHAAREAAGRGHALPPSVWGQPNPSGQRPALRLDNPQQPLFIYLFLLKLGKVKPLHLCSVPAPNYRSFFPLSPSPSSLAQVQSRGHSRHTASSQHRPGHAHFPRLQAAIFIPPAAFDSSGMKLPLKKEKRPGGAPHPGTPVRGSPAPRDCYGEQGYPHSAARGVPAFSAPVGASTHGLHCDPGAAARPPPAQHGPCSAPGKAHLQRARALAPRSKRHSTFLHISFCFRFWVFFF